MADERKVEAVKHIAIGAGIGLLLGAVVAVLWSPKSGKEVRAKISEKIQSFKDKRSPIDKVHNK